MRTTLIRLAAALATFALGVTLASLWLFFDSPKLKLGREGDSCRYRQRAVLAPLPHEPLVYGEPLPPRAPAAPKAVETVKAETCEGTAAGRTVTGGILNGKAISKPAPAYPAEARTARVSGTVVVRVTVDECGDVEQAEAISGPALLRETATEAAYKTRFSPTRLAGDPVKVAGMITYNFVLQ